MLISLHCVGSHSSRLTQACLLVHCKYFVSFLQHIHSHTGCFRGPGCYSLVASHWASHVWMMDLSSRWSIMSCECHEHGHISLDTGQMGHIHSLLVLQMRVNTLWEDPLSHTTSEKEAGLLNSFWCRIIICHAGLKAIQSPGPELCCNSQLCGPGTPRSVLVVSNECRFTGFKIQDQYHSFATASEVIGFIHLFNHLH